MGQSWSRLAGHASRRGLHALTWDEGITEQVEQVLGEDGDVVRSETQLHDLVMQAKTQWQESGTVRGKPQKRTAAFQGPGDAAKCQKRSFQRKKHRREQRVVKKKHRKRLACYRASDEYNVKRKGHLLIGTWNTRGPGAPMGKDPEGKTRALFRLIAERKWSCALLTDVRFPEDGCCEVNAAGATWLLVHEGRVGVALNPCLAARWRAGGSIIVRASGWSESPRSFGLVLPAVGWKPGLLLVPVYAPLVTVAG